MSTICLRSIASVPLKRLSVFVGEVAMEEVEFETVGFFSHYAFL